jgi:hypothetical protein
MEFLLSALAGIVGGVAIAGVGMIYSAVTGGGFWTLPNSIGGILMGAEAGNTRSFGVVTLVGACFHMVLSAVYGIATVYLARRFNVGFVYAGIAVGIFFWLFNHFLIGQATEGARKHVQFNPVWLAFLLHVLYGAVTGLVAIPLVG